MVLLVVVASLRCVRAQRRRARSGKDGATWHPVSTLLALRKKQLRYKLQQVLVRLLRMQVCVCSLCAGLISRCCSTQAFARPRGGHQQSRAKAVRALSTRDDRSCDAFPLHSGSPIIHSSLQSSESLIHKRATSIMAVPDKVALGLFFFWW